MGSTLTEVRPENKMAEDKSQEHERDARKHGALSCPRCAKPTLYRVKRKGLLQRLLYPRFGYFPWKCKECNAVQLYKARGVRHRRAET